MYLIFFYKIKVVIGYKSVTVKPLRLWHEYPAIPLARDKPVLDSWIILSVCERLLSF